MRYRITVKAIIFFDDRILLLRKPQGLWDLPGGRLEEGEHPEECVLREVLEETGVDADPVMIVDCFDRDPAAEDKVFVTMFLCDTAATIDDIKISGEHVEARLMHLAEIAAMQLEIYPAYRESILRTARVLFAEHSKSRMTA